MECVLVADDLTGACDTGAQFASRGLTTRVNLGKGLKPSNVVAISTNTRRLTPQEAASSLRDALRDVDPSRSSIVFKKIDSTLRGHVIAECDVLRDMAQLSYGVIAPALPAQSRTVKNGWLEVNDLSGQWRVDVRTLLASQGRAPALAAAPNGMDPAMLAAEMEQAARASGYVLCDAASQEDLALIAQAIDKSKSRPLWIGSAGLARYAALSLSTGSAAIGTSTRTSSTAPVLLVAGSQHPATNSQLAQFGNECSCQVLELLSASAAQVRSALQSGQHLVLRADVQDLRVGQNRMRTLLEEVRSCKIAAIFLTGGDTAELVCRAGQAEQLLLEGELLEGVATGVIEGGLLDGLIFATKSGGFGDATCLVKTTNALIRGKMMGDF